jgi:4-hydroxybenzoate polyprenyltransferase
MGCCRTLNVLLGMSALAGPWHAMHYVVAAGVGCYIVGVTWFARTEARQSNRVQLAMGTVVMMAGIGLLASYPAWADAALAAVSRPRFVEPARWPVVWSVVGLMIGWRCLWAVWDPLPQRVQYAVKNCIFSLIVLDGMAAFGVRGLWWAVAVLALLLPTMYLGRWIYST